MDSLDRYPDYPVPAPSLGPGHDQIRSRLVAAAGSLSICPVVHHQLQHLCAAWRHPDPFSLDSKAFFRRFDSQLLARCSKVFFREPGLLAKAHDLHLVYGAVAEHLKFVDEADFVALNHEAEKKKAITKRLKNADGIIRRDKSGSARTFLFSKTFERWYPDGSTRKRLAKHLRLHRIVGKGRRSDTCTREIFVAALGSKVACYVLSRKQLRRSTTKRPTARRCGQAIPGRGRPTTAKMPS